MGLIHEAKNIVSGYSLTYNSRVALAVLFVIAGTVFAAIFLKRTLKGWKVRVVGAAAVLLLSSFLYIFVYTNDKVYERAANNENINIWSDQQVYISKGFAYPFLHSVKDAFPTPPDGYDAAEAEAALAEYPDSGIDDDQKVNIISVMLESYADLSVFETVRFNVDVYGPLYALKEESRSGTLIDNVFAGGTINTERAFLTGFATIDNYRTSTNSYVYYLKEQGYYTEGLHAGDGWFYNRQNVNPYLGFDNYYFLEDYENGDRTDEFLFSQILQMYEDRDPEIPYFNYSLSYQNHGAYDSESTVETAYIEQGDLSNASYNILNNYLSGISDTTERMAAFTDHFRDMDEPVVILFFGDHMPWLGNGESVYAELGINMDVSTEEGFYNHYSTPYLIWANDAAKQALGNDFTGDGGSFSPCFLMNELFALCSWEGNSYMKVTDELKGYTDIVSTPTEYFRENGTLTTELTGDALSFWTVFQNIEYYCRYNFID